MMDDIGPYAHLNPDRSPWRFLMNGRAMPGVLAQNPATGEWVPVPVDSRGFARPDLAGLPGNWQTLDPTDSNALRSKGIDPFGAPRDYSAFGQMMDALRAIPDTILRVLPKGKSAPDPLPHGGIRGDLNDGGPQMLIENGISAGEHVSLENRSLAIRMSALQGLMREQHSEYWKGPKADVLQQEYRDLVEASEQDKTFGESVSRFPEAARTLIGSSIDADAQPDIDDSALAGRMVELQTLIADQHSDYWRGPEADALQKEYRDLIEMQDRRKRRDEDVSLSMMVP